MDSSEKLVENHLRHRGYCDLVYEPDGNVPPDFLVNGTIAVEVRRLNQINFSGPAAKGLEEVAIPLWNKIIALLASMGAPTKGESWFVHFRFSRPVENWKTLEPKLQAGLKAFASASTQEPSVVAKGRNFESKCSAEPQSHIRQCLSWLAAPTKSRGGLFSRKWRRISAIVRARRRGKFSSFGPSIRSGGLRWLITLVTVLTTSIRRCSVSKYPSHIHGTKSSSLTRAITIAGLKSNISLQPTSSGRG